MAELGPQKRLDEVARDAFGVAELRPGQRPAMLALLEGRDTLVVMPTGGGKSLIYQVPALLLDGPTVVVVDMMRGYAETLSCRRQYLLAYFGETLVEPCGNCDTCASGSAYDLAEDAEDSPFTLNSRVTHAEFGEGVVMRFEGDRIVVLFDAVGYRTLQLDVVVARGLLSENSA